MSGHQETYALDANAFIQAKAKGKVVVTLEEHDPVIRKKVPLPNVCRAFDVEWITPFEMLRRLDVKLSWAPA